MTSGGAGAQLAAALGYPRPGPPSRRDRLVRAVAATAPAARVLSRTVRPVDELLARWRGRGISVPALLAGLPAVALTTTGARTGLPRTVPLIPVVTGPVFAVLGTNFGGERTPAWAVNLEARPEAEVAFGDRTVPVRARLLDGAERAEVVEAASGVYVGFGRYLTRAAHRRVRVFALEPR